MWNIIFRVVEIYRHLHEYQCNVSVSDDRRSRSTCASPAPPPKAGPPPLPLSPVLLREVPWSSACGDGHRLGFQYWFWQLAPKFVRYRWICHLLSKTTNLKHDHCRLLCPYNFDVNSTKCTVFIGPFLCRSIIIWTNGASTKALLCCAVDALHINLDEAEEI